MKHTIELTSGELALARKALQLMKMAHDVVETAEETPDKETMVDRLIRKMREEEDKQNDEGNHQTAADGSDRQGDQKDDKDGCSEQRDETVC